jgi:hypothetical protein
VDEEPKSPFAPEADFRVYDEMSQRLDSMEMPMMAMEAMSHDCMCTVYI